MKRRRDLKAFLTGSLVVAVSLSTAWAIGRGTPSEQPPMEQLLAEAEAEVRWDLPVTRNDHVDNWIGFLTGRNRDKTNLWLERSGKYVPMIQAELRKRNMPEDLIYLAFIESGFSPNAYSRAAAVGLWQFISETGQRYGLEVSSYVDERRDPVKATGAALTYLQELYDRFGSWYLAAAAYNTGENRVARIMREETGKERGTDADFWKIARRLPRETRDYVPLMLAAAHIGKEPAKYGFVRVEYQQPISFDEVWVPAAVSLDAVARAAGVTEKAVEELNPQLLRDVTPPNRAWNVRIPAGHELAFAENFPRVFQEERATKREPTYAAVTHKVRRGETLSHIARRYDVSVASLTSANQGLNARRLQIGQSVRIPKATSSAAAPASKAVNSRFHSVQRGENLSVIAARYDVSVKRLRALNNLRSSLIRPGQKLRVS